MTAGENVTELPLLFTLHSHFSSSFALLYLKRQPKENKDIRARASQEAF
jgi:hypothetical protein